MRETLKNAWKVVEIRKKILYTVGMLLIYRLLCFVPVPGVDASLIATKPRFKRSPCLASSIR